MNKDIFEQTEALTFDDLLIEPGYSEVLPGDVDVHARLTRDITPKYSPSLGAMDTVTESRLAIALARKAV